MSKNLTSSKTRLSSVDSGSMGHSSGSEGSSRSGRSHNGKGKRHEGKSDSRLVVTPWYPEGMHKSKLKLGEEIDALHKMLQLTPEEVSKRHMARSSIQEVLQKFWPDATVKVYGSFAYGMSLPSSNLDLVCEDCRDLDDLPAIYQRMGESRIEVEESSGNFEAAFARLVLPFLNITVNISFVVGKSMARKSVSEVRRLLAQFPACAPVYAVVRLVLQQSRCGDSRRGGLPSYAALVMLLHTCYRCETPDDASMLLMDFFRLYGTGPSSPPISEPLFVEDPLCPDNDVAAGCVRMPQIRAMFQNCAMTLEKWVADKWEGYRGRSPLSSILAYDGLWAANRLSSSSPMSGTPSSHHSGSFSGSGSGM
eukprot:TRINITY_DN5857_c0_g1_i3.p1 TRINITY_DN5857_c0_g1~~TRINITY_DN5857_c0_g1_i3.p1  ORF type:complete len:380 (+),score=124.39 TRINITY_DN5857_c0_g1_i3:47-1141(+)